MIRVGLLGAGRIGQIHGRNVAASGRARLVAVADAFEQATPFRATRPDLATVAPGIAKGLAEAGLTLPASDLPGLADVVADLSATAGKLKGNRPYGHEPAAVFSLSKGA